VLNQEYIMSYQYDSLYGAAPALSTDQITPLSVSPIQPLTTADIASLGTINLSGLTSAWSIGGSSNTWGSTGNISLTGSSSSGSYNLGAGLGAGAAYPYIYTSTGTGTPNLSPMNLSSSGKIQLTGPDADVIMGDVSLRDTLTAIQTRLGMLVPDPKIEAEFDELRELAEKYQATLKKCQEQLKIVDILSQDDGTLP
jgi:hypothetical protein